MFRPPQTLHPRHDLHNVLQIRFQAARASRNTIYQCCNTGRSGTCLPKTAWTVRTYTQTHFSADGSLDSIRSLLDPSGVSISICLTIRIQASGRRDNRLENFYSKERVTEQRRNSCVNIHGWSFQTFCCESRWDISTTNRNTTNYSNVFSTKIIFMQ